MYEDAPQVLKNFLTQKLTIEGKSPNTVKEYYYDLRGFLGYLKEIKDFDGEVDIDFIKGIELNDIYEYLMYISNEKKNGARTRSRRVSSIKSFFKYLHIKVKLIDSNPTEALDPPKFISTVPRYLELDESKRLLSCVDGRHKERDFAILTLFLNCGLRLSELVGINLADIKKDSMVVKGKGNKERTIYLNDACLSAISNYLAVRPKLNVKDEKALFISGQNKRIYYKTVQHLVKKYIAAAGLDPTKYSTHKLRHTAATLMYKYGKVDVRTLQTILGHEQLSTTQIYTRVSNDQVKEAVDKNPLASFGKEQKDQ
ncbi:MAG: tyrosine recombinase XerC [Ruminococcaceae bacterium]|nr:tyrosine recombinase XerC [Oscillospiraceae bacterium]